MRLVLLNHPRQTKEGRGRGEEEEMRREERGREGNRIERKRMRAEKG